MEGVHQNKPGVTPGGQFEQIIKQFISPLFRPYFFIKVKAQSDLSNATIKVTGRNVKSIYLSE